MKVSIGNHNLINKNIEERNVEIVEMKTSVSKIKTQEKLMLVEWIKWKTDEIKDKLENRQRSVFKIPWNTIKRPNLQIMRME